MREPDTTEILARILKRLSLEVVFRDTRAHHRIADSLQISPRLHERCLAGPLRVIHCLGQHGRDIAACGLGADVHIVAGARVSATVVVGQRDRAQAGLVRARSHQMLVRLLLGHEMMRQFVIGVRISGADRTQRHEARDAGFYGQIDRTPRAVAVDLVCNLGPGGPPNSVAAITASQPSHTPSCGSVRSPWRNSVPAGSTDVSKDSRISAKGL